MYHWEQRTEENFFWRWNGVNGFMQLNYPIMRIGLASSCHSDVVTYDFSASRFICGECCKSTDHPDKMFVCFKHIGDTLPRIRIRLENWIEEILLNHRHDPVSVLLGKIWLPEKVFEECQKQASERDSDRIFTDNQGNKKMNDGN